MTKTKGPGRPRVYASRAERQKAYRARFNRKIEAQRRAVRWCKQFCTLILEAPDPARLRTLAETVAKQLPD